MRRRVRQLARHAATPRLTPACAAVLPPGPAAPRLKQPLTLVDGFFHMHELGKAAVTRHYRCARAAPAAHA